MADGRSRDRWAHTSHLLAMLANVFRSKGKAAKPADYDPYTEIDRKAAPAKKITIGLLIAALVDRDPKAIAEVMKG